MRPKVLQLAYCCSPYHGSEESVGWNIARESARHCDTWVITEEKKFGPSIRRYLDEQGPIPGLTFEFVPERFWAHWMWAAKFGYLSYNWWHQRALKVARQLHAQHQFDLVHQVNIIGFREPGYLSRLPAPFVWGPVGGGQNYPSAFLSEAGWAGRCKEAARTVANRWQVALGSRSRAAASNSAAVIAANKENADLLRKLGAANPHVVSEVASSIKHDIPPAPRSKDGVLRVLWSGTHTPNKALSLLLKALAKLPNHKFELNVLGAGGETKRWQKLARRLGIDQKIHWLGWLPHDQAVEHFKTADLFAFTSLRDTTGTVLVESLSYGTPILCLDHQGAREVVTDQCGVKVPVQSPQQVVNDLAQALADLSGDSNRLVELSAGALKRAQEYTATRLGARIWSVYQDVLSLKSGHPSSSDQPLESNRDDSIACYG